MNLICFPHYTCGGLLCDIFAQTFSPVAPNGGIGSFLHSIGKIGDSDSVLDQFDAELFNSTIQNFNYDQNIWIGTHCWPGNIDLSKFDQVLLITTTTFRSKLYRWIRAYYHYYSPSELWMEKVGVDRIDKERETAKNYLKPFLPVHADNVINLEFSEVVDVSQEFKKLVKTLDYHPHISRWQELNNFLYDSDIWNSTPVKRFYEAEFEIQLQKFYLYE
jgi:hypothetical protein